VHVRGVAPRDRRRQRSAGRQSRVRRHRPGPRRLGAGSLVIRSRCGIFCHNL